MEAKEFYSLAVTLMENMKTKEPQLVSGSDSEICVMVTEKSQTVYAGVTSVKAEAGRIMRSCPEFNAIMAMLPSGETLVEKLVTISFSTKEISQPCSECFKLLYRVNPDNRQTQVFVAQDKAVRAEELLAPEENAAPVTLPSPEKEKEKEEPKKQIAANPEAAGFAAESEAAAPPPAMNKAPKNPLAAAADFGDFSGDGDFGFEAAEAPEEPEEEQQPEQQEQENPFFAQQGAPNVAPQVMGAPQQTGYPQQPYGGYPQAQPYGYPQQQSQYGYAQQSVQYGFAQQSQYGYAQQQPQYGFVQQGYGQPQSMYMRQQSVYMQPGQQPQSVYMQQSGQQPQSVYMQPQPYVQPSVAAHSQQVSAYQQSSYYSQNGTAPAKSNGSTFRNRLANFMDDSEDTVNSTDNAALSEAELRKQAQERKQNAKRRR